MPFYYHIKCGQKNKQLNNIYHPRYHLAGWYREDTVLISNVNLIFAPLLLPFSFFYYVCHICKKKETALDPQLDRQLEVYTMRCSTSGKEFRTSHALYKSRRVYNREKK